MYKNPSEQLITIDEAAGKTLEELEREKRQKIWAATTVEKLLAQADEQITYSAPTRWKM